MRTLIALLLSLWLAPAWAQLPMTGAGKGTPGGAPMVSPLLSLAGSNSGPSNSAANYAYIAYGRAGGAWTGAESQRQIPFPVAGTITDLRVNFPTAVVTGRYAITLRKNGAGTALTCTINSSAQCSDTNSVTVAAGDLIDWEVTPTGTPTANTFIQISAKFTSSANSEGFLIAGGSNANVSNTAANYFGFGGATANNATEAVVSGLVATSGTIDNLYIAAHAAPTSGKQYVATVYKNGVATGLACTVANTATTCNSTGANVPVSLVATDTISIEMCPGTHSGVAGSCTPTGTPTAGIYHGSVRWVPSTPGEMLSIYTMNTGFDTTGTRYAYYNGASNSNEGTEPNACNLAPTSVTVKKLYVSQSAAPGGATSRAYTLRKGTCVSQSSQSITCTVGSGATSCNDTSNTVSASAGDFLDWQIVPSGTNAAMTWAKIGSVVTSP